jgi:hypothetical protein
LRAHDLDIAWGLETILRSRLFFADANLGGRIVPPAELVAGTLAALERRDSPPSTLVLAEWVARLGQDLFHPPNVFGWRGGRAWITTATMLSRARFAAALARGELCDGHGGEQALHLAERHGRAHDLDDVSTFYSELLGAPRLEPERASALPASAGVARVLEEMLASPEAQLA